MSRTLAQTYHDGTATLDALQRWAEEAIGGGFPPSETERREAGLAFFCAALPTATAARRGELIDMLPQRPRGCTVAALRDTWQRAALVLGDGDEPPSWMVVAVDKLAEVDGAQRAETRRWATTLRERLAGKPVGDLLTEERFGE